MESARANVCAHWYQRFELEAARAGPAPARTALLALRKAAALVEAQRRALDEREGDALLPLHAELWGAYFVRHLDAQLATGVGAGAGAGAGGVQTLAETVAENLHKRRKHGARPVVADDVPPLTVGDVLGDVVDLLARPLPAQPQVAAPLPPMTPPPRSHAVWRDQDAEADDGPSARDFVTAREQLTINAVQTRQRGGRGGVHSHRGAAGGDGAATAAAAVAAAAAAARGRALGARGHRGRFVSPLTGRNNGNASDDELKSELGFYNLAPPSARTGGAAAGAAGARGAAPDQPVDERLKNIEPKMIELISNEMLDRSPQVGWDDIAGLEHAKKSIREIVVWPMLRPDIFTGLRGPPKGLLLFGPPGTGKTLIGKCIASQAKATFFSISASSLTSKWVGEGEKMVRALFAVARCHQPAVIFIDEIDSLLSQRTDGEMEANRRIKTEFLVQLDGATTSSEDRLLIVGATNRPHEIDEAARRRLVKRLYIPLPEDGARGAIVRSLMRNQKHDLSDPDVDEIVAATAGYSGSDMANLCREAALGPIRTIHDIACITADDVRPIQLSDFRYALTQVRASVSQKDLQAYSEWNKTFGSLG